MEKRVKLVDKGQRLKEFNVYVGDSLCMISRTTPEWLLDYLKGTLVDATSLRPGAFACFFSYVLNKMRETGYVVESVEIAGQARNDGESK